MQNSLSIVVGEADVSPQSFAIDIYNPGTNVNIPNLTFSTSTVRSALIRYAIFRSTSSASGYEAGELTIVFNPNGNTGSKWEVGRTYVGDASIVFNVTDTGQVQFTTATLAGTGHTGTISFAAQALLQTY